MTKAKNTVGSFFKIKYDKKIEEMFKRFDRLGVEMQKFLDFACEIDFAVYRGTKLFKDKNLKVYGIMYDTMKDLKAATKKFKRVEGAIPFEKEKK